MTQTSLLTRETLRTPKAAAIAGMLFSGLTVAVFWLLWNSVPADPQEPGLWLTTNANAVALGLNLVPFAGIAFLWFIGVLRDRLGDREDRFFATVFFGSGILFLGMLFAAAAMVGAILITFGTQPKELLNSATFHFARATAQTIMHIYMIKMAAVFMITASTLAIYIRFVPRWLALLGYPSRATASVRQLLYSLELLPFPALGIPHEHSDSERRSTTAKMVPKSSLSTYADSELATAMFSPRNRLHVLPPIGAFCQLRTQ